MPHYREPRFFDRIFNGVVAGATRLGLSVWGSRVLRVRGRTSGQWRTTPVNVLSLDQHRYLVAPRGETQWVRNLRVAGGGELAVGRRVEPFRAEELADVDKEPVLRAYLRRWGFEVGRFFDGVSADASSDELRRIAPEHPVFRLSARRPDPAAGTPAPRPRQGAPMEFDLWLPTASPMSTPEVLAAVAQEAEDRAITTVWVGEHVVTFEHYDSRYPYAESGEMPLPPGTGLLEPFTTLAFMAGITTTVRLGTAMCLLPQRNPVYTAKEVATLDWLSGGRVDLGIGVGWLREEFEAVAAPWPNRGARTDEYLDVLSALWRDDPSSFGGDYYELAPCNMHPKPVQDPLPLHIGGESEPALRRAARVSQGWHTFNRPPAELPPALARLDALLDEYDRTRAELRITVCPYFQPLDAAITEQYAAAGADAVSALFFAMSAEEVPAAFDALEPCRQRAAAC